MNFVIVHKDTPVKVVTYCFLGLAFMMFIYLAESIAQHPRFNEGVFSKIIL